ncbi:hypothetical protein EPD60_16060 [Flaviaesturariibacter flavus]|uniref:PKD domain-containing protein n=1 Tax=Flaviaesturariibacter flavus TaxID=2502780 RepID=A0A4R1B3K8_9BACT|nr:right-handed parallel beta-helix repeat-containing protein [Flaviaesturariibacter flavus]TCJ12070.1 hypothetical protein EPD60_16060 [Flaviaesturariibacter flavus]
MKIRILASLLGCLLLLNVQARTIFVRPNATGNNNGSSWLHAYTSLTAGLNVALAGDTVRVAAGTYVPGIFISSRFFMPNGTVVLGGYSATDTLQARDWRRNASILSGITGNSSPHQRIATILYGQGSNASTVWDGFVVQDCEGGDTITTGPVALRSSQATLRNFIIRNNEGGVSLHGSNAVLENIIFLRNHFKAALVTTGSSPQVRNCVFAKTNSNDWTGSAIAINGGSPEVLHCTFLHNASNTVRAEGGATLKVRNSIFYENGLGLTPGYFNSEQNIQLAGSTAVIANTLFDVDHPGTALKISVNPRFRDTANLAGPDGFFFTADDGLQLLAPCSPALNAGNSAFLNGLSTDITGAPRSIGLPDLGAYEFQGSTGTAPNTIYVRAGATGSGDGSSWTNAFTSLQKALDACGDTIKISAGTYVPAGYYSTSFQLEKGRVLLGGYPATGTPTDAQRAPLANPTILSGRESATSVRAAVILTRNSDTSTIIDGFTIRDAKSSAVGINVIVGGIALAEKAGLRVRNCSITANEGSGITARRGSSVLLTDSYVDGNTGTGFFIDSSTLRFRRGSLSNNSTTIDASIAGYNGGGAVLRSADVSFDSVLVRSNRANYYGGAFFAAKSRMTFRYCAVYHNNAGSHAQDFYNDSCTASFEYCSFRDSVNGGDHENFYQFNNSNSTFRFTTFRKLSANTNSGGAFMSDASKASFVSCVFDSCQAPVLYISNNSTLNFTNSVLASNRGTVLRNRHSIADLLNCTIVRNYTTNNVFDVFQAGGTDRVISNADSARLYLRNSILWANYLWAINAPPVEIEKLGGAQADDSSVVVLQNSITQFYGTAGVNGNLKGSDPRLVNYYRPAGPDNIWMTSDDGIRLMPCSPAINAGQAGINTEPTDIMANPRSSGTIDMGPYEFQGAPAQTRTVYVNAAATGANDGSSWNSAYTSLWSAINNTCSDTIKVAEGVYKPAVHNRDSGFFLQRNRVLLGGYPATGNPTDAQRAPFRYKTILDGDIGVVGDTSDNISGVVKIFSTDTAVVLDGFHVRGGKAFWIPLTNTTDFPAAASNGGGIYIYNAKATIRNCTFSENGADLNGGAVYYQNSRVNFDNCRFFNNWAGQWGGAVCSRLDNQGNTFRNCIFANNRAYSGNFGDGGAIFAYSGGVRIENSVFYKNESRRGGGAVYGYFVASDMNISNSTFVQNMAGDTLGSAIYARLNTSINSSLLKYTNNIFKGNSRDTARYWSDIYDDGCVSTAIGCPRSSITYNRVQPFFFYSGDVNFRSEPLFVNENDGDGPDDEWGTADDGLRLQPCSPLVNIGLTSAVTGNPTDLLSGPRTIGSKPDLGAYEFDGNPAGMPLLLNANDSLIANREYTTADGWTHYYQDCRYLLSVRKNGRNIGTVGSGTFRVKVGTTTSWSSGAGSDLTGAAWNSAGTPFVAMNRFFQITPTTAVPDSILVRFPYSSRDWSDLRGSNPALGAHTDLQFFANNNSQAPFDGSIPATAWNGLNHGSTPTLRTWTWTQSDTSTFFAEYYVRNFGGGSGGTRLAAPLVDLVVASATVNPAGAAPNGPAVVTFTESNNGTAAAGPHAVYFYLSTDNVLTPGANGDVLAGQVNIAGALAAGATSAPVTGTFNVPCALAAGNYTLFVVTDAAAAIPEINEANNSRPVAFTVAAGSATPPAPVIGASPSATVCAGTPVTLTANTGNCAGCVVTWSNGASGSSITVSTAGTYTATVTNGCGTSNASQVVTVNTLPNVTLGSATSTYCVGSSYTLTAAGASTYAWSGSDLSAATGNPVIYTPATAGTFSIVVTGTDANGCTKTATRNVTVGTTPVADILQGPITICSGTTVNLQVQGNATLYVWNPTVSDNFGTLVTATPSTTTTYYVTASRSHPVSGVCSVKDSVKITVLPAGSCSGIQPDIVLRAGSFSPASVNAGSPLSTTSSEINQGGVATGTHKVYIYLSPDNNLTPGANGDLLIGQYNSFSLSPGFIATATNYSVTVPCTVAAGSYYVFYAGDGASEVTESNEVNNIFMVPTPLTVNGVNLNVSAGSSTLCSGSSTTLTASGASTYSWSPATGLSATTGTTVTATPAATTTYTVTSTSGGCGVTRTITLTVIPTVIPSVTVTASGCPSANLTFTANPVNGGGSPSFTWLLNGTQAGSGPTYSIPAAVNGMQVQVQLTSSAACATPASVSSASTTVSCITTAVSSISGVDEMSVAPNPSRGLVTVRVRLATMRRVSFVLRDGNGALLQQTLPQQATGTLSRSFNLQPYANGVYYLETWVNNEKRIDRILLVH